MQPWMHDDSRLTRSHAFLQECVDPTPSHEGSGGPSPSFSAEALLLAYLAASATSLIASQALVESVLQIFLHGESFSSAQVCYYLPPFYHPKYCLTKAPPFLLMCLDLPPFTLSCPSNWRPCQNPRALCSMIRTRTRYRRGLRSSC